MNEGIGKKVLDAKKRSYLTSIEKKRLLEKFYQIPQPCTQRRAATLLDISQATFSRLIGNRFAKKISGNDVQKETDECARKKNKKETCEVPGEMKRMTTKEKLNLLKKYDRLLPCTQRAAASELNLPQSSLSYLLKVRNELIENSYRELGRRRVVTESSSNLSVTSSAPIGRRPPRNRRAPKRFDFDASEEVLETSEEENGSSEDSSVSSEVSSTHQLNSKQENILREYFMLQKLNRCSQREAAEKLGISQSTLSVVLRAAGGIESKQNRHVLHSTTEQNEINVEETDEIAAQPHDRRHRMRSLPEKIKIFRMFDAMQPCSQNKARAVLNISSSTLSGLIANRNAIEEEFRKQLTDTLQVLKKYDALESHQLPHAHRICGLPKSKLDLILGKREFWEEEAENHEHVAEGQNITPVTDVEHVEKELLIWYQANCSQIVTWMQLMNKARELVKSLGSSFVPTDPWMSKWKRKVSHLLNKTDIPPATARVDCIHETSTVLPALKDYHPDNIFNLDETGLYYRAMPGFVPGKDDWVTVIFTCNMSGTEKKRLTVVGKSEAPLFFGILSLPLDYKHSSDSRMSQEILSNLLKEWNTQLRANNRNIALILDNCRMHMNIEDKFDRIHLFFVSNNNSSQPLNRGIISYTKTQFRKKLFQTVYKLGDNAKAVNDVICKITLLDSLYMLAEAWDEVPEKVIINAFAELAFPNSSHPVPDEEPNEDIDRLNELDEDLLSITSDEDGRECMEDELSNGDYMVVQMEGVVDPTGEETETTTANDVNPTSIKRNHSKSGGLDSELSKSSDSPGHPKSSKMSKVSVKVENILGESLCEDLGLSKSLEKEPPSSAEVHEALGVIKRFLRMKGGTLEDFTDFTQLEMKVLSKIKS